MGPLVALTPPSPTPSFPIPSPLPPQGAITLASLTASSGTSPAEIALTVAVLPAPAKEKDASGAAGNGSGAGGKNGGGGDGGGDDGKSVAERLSDELRDVRVKFLAAMKVWGGELRAPCGGEMCFPFAAEENEGPFTYNAFGPPSRRRGPSCRQLFQRCSRASR